MKILVTGAAGLVGGALCEQLMARGHRVTALVHRATAICGNDGQPVEGVTLLPGDVRRPGFGLATIPDVDLVIHSAAVTAFDAPEELYAAVNTGGARNAAALGLPLLHVSTAYVCGTRDGRIGEDETGSEFVNGYEASKAAGEAMVRAVMAKGLPAAIARPSIVVGDWANGAIRSFDNIYMLFRLIAEGRVRTLPAAPGASLDLVPIDHVTGSLVAMAEGFGRFAGKTLHLVGSQPQPLTVLGEAVAGFPGLGRPQFVAADGFDPAALPPIERRYHAAAAALYTAYLQRGPRFDTSVAGVLLPACPPCDAEWVSRLIGHCLEQGFVRAREPQRISG
jgi:nucleoside-diphosphate-sugar epimerase